MSLPETPKQINPSHGTVYDVSVTLRVIAYGETPSDDAILAAELIRRWNAFPGLLAAREIVSAAMLDLIHDGGGHVDEASARSYYATLNPPSPGATDADS